MVVITLCGIAFLTVKKRIKKDKKSKFQPHIFMEELPIEEGHGLPASAKLPELLDEREHRSQLANTGILELIDRGRRDDVELP